MKMQAVQSQELILPDSNFTVPIRELIVPEVYDKQLDSSGHLTESSSENLNTMYGRLRASVFPAFVIRRASLDKSPEELHQRRLESLQVISGLIPGKSTEFHGNPKAELFMHYDGDKPNRNAFLHTTYERSGHAWFARGGPDLPRLMGIAIQNSDMGIYNPAQGIPTNDRMWDGMGELFKTEETDSRLCSTDFYATYLQEGDSVVFESYRQNDVWHAFDTDAGKSWRLAVGTELIAKPVARL